MSRIPVVENDPGVRGVVQEAFSGGCGATGHSASSTGSPSTSNSSGQNSCRRPSASRTCKAVRPDDLYIRSIVPATPDKCGALWPARTRTLAPTCVSSGLTSSSTSMAVYPVSRSHDQGEATGRERDEAYHGTHLSRPR